MKREPQKAEHLRPVDLVISSSEKYGKAIGDMKDTTKEVHQLESQLKLSTRAAA